MKQKFSFWGGGRGRGAGRGQTQAGRGFGRAKTSKPAEKKTSEDYTYHIGSSKQASDYVATTQYIINYIKRTYEHGNDIGLALAHHHCQGNDTKRVQNKTYNGRLVNETEM